MNVPNMIVTTAIYACVVGQLYLSVVVFHAHFTDVPIIPLEVAVVVQTLCGLLEPEYRPDRTAHRLADLMDIHGLRYKTMKSVHVCGQGVTISHLVKQCKTINTQKISHGIFFLCHAISNEEKLHMGSIKRVSMG